MRSRLVLRARVLSVFFIFAALLLIARLYFVQVVHGEEYRQRAAGQYVASAPDTEGRSDIFFSTKDGDLVAAAVMQTGWRIAIEPDAITDPEAAYTRLAEYVTLDKDRFLKAAAKKGDPYEEVAFRIPSEVGSKLRSEKMPGVLLVPDQWRAYPGGQLAAHTVGFVGYQGDKKVGVYGLEKAWQRTLAKESSGLAVNPFAEVFASIGSALSSDPSGEKGDIITTIEPAVQQKLEDTLERVRTSYSTKVAGGIVMDPASGAIVAIALRPAFDPNTYNTVDDVSVFTNALVENIYEMGSIIKPLTMAAGIDTGVVSATTMYEDRGCIEKSDKRICNYDGKARGRVSMQEVLNQSLNTGVSFVVDKMGHNIFGNYMHAFGLGDKTGIDLPNEATGIVHSIEGGSDVDYASASFGQGIGTSAIATTRALSALANGGTLPDPHVVKAVKLESGVTRAIPSEPGPRVLKAESAEEVTRMLVEVFDTALLKGELKQEHYSIAAKTGTAQIAIPGGGGYYEDRFLHSFFGYLPAHEAKYIVFLFAVEPRGAEFASATLARPFLDIAKYLINYFDIPPDR